MGKTKVNSKRSKNNVLQHSPTKNRVFTTHRICCVNTMSNFTCMQGIFFVLMLCSILCIQFLAEGSLTRLNNFSILAISFSGPLAFSQNKKKKILSDTVIKLLKTSPLYNWADQKLVDWSKNGATKRDAYTTSRVIKDSK